MNLLMNQVDIGYTLFSCSYKRGAGDSLYNPFPRRHVGRVGGEAPGEGGGPHRAARRHEEPQEHPAGGGGGH